MHHVQVHYRDQSSAWLNKNTRLTFVEIPHFAVYALRSPMRLQTRHSPSGLGINLSTEVMASQKAPPVKSPPGLEWKIYTNWIVLTSLAPGQASPETSHQIRSRWVLTHSSHGNQDILPRANVLVVGAIAIQVGGTVHQPGGVEHHGIPQEGANTQAVEESFTPEIPRHYCGQDEAHQQETRLVVPTMRLHIRACGERTLTLPSTVHS